jgi:hypothetical protein
MEIELGFVREECCECGIIFFLPENFVSVKKRTHGNFHCPNGHALTYPEDQTSKDDLREQIKVLKQDKIQLIHQLDQAEGRASEGKPPKGEDAQEPVKEDEHAT